MAIQHAWLWKDKLEDGVFRDIGPILIVDRLPRCTGLRSGIWFVCSRAKENVVE